MRYLINTSKLKKSLLWLCAGAGTLVPGYSFFTSYPPPIFPGIGILTSCLSAAIIVITFATNKSSGENCPEHFYRKVSLLLVLAFLCLTMYVLLLRYCTVLEPQNYSHRFQVGFWKYDWSLTDAGINLKKTNPLSPIEDWMMREGAFIDGGPEIIWQPWSIITAGCSLLFFYMTGFVLWTIGFTLLARRIKS